MKAALVLALLFPAIALASAPATRTWPIDPADSYVQFSIRKLWIAHTTGTFPGLAGAVHEITSDHGARLAQVDATLQVASLEMHNTDDRGVALGPDFFGALQYPLIRFDSRPFPIDELATGGDLRGMLALHGEHQPVTLTLQASRCPQQPLDCVIRARGTISRAAFGMKNMRGVLSDKVTLALTIVVLPAAHGIPSPPPRSGTAGR